VYGSWQIKKPSLLTKTDINMKNPNKIIIPDPKGKLKFDENYEFYLTFETLKKTSILRIKNYMKGPETN